MSVKITVFDRFFAQTILRLVPGWVRPNYFTILRYLLVPAVILLLLKNSLYWGTIVFIFATITDALDGALARTRNQVTEWGSFHDPIADKLLIGSTALIIVPKLLGLYLVVAILMTEILVVVTAYVRNHGHPIPARTAGKVKMVLQSVGLGSLLIFMLTNQIGWLSLAGSALWLSVVAGILSFSIFYSV